jgi:hypothetical protein
MELRERKGTHYMRQPVPLNDYPIKWMFYDTEIGKRLNFLVRESLLRKRSRNIEKAESQGRKCVAELEINVIKKIIKKAKEGKNGFFFSTSKKLNSQNSFNMPLLYYLYYIPANTVRL